MGGGGGGGGGRKEFSKDHDKKASMRCTYIIILYYVYTRVHILRMCLYDIVSTNHTMYTTVQRVPTLCMLVYEHTCTLIIRLVHVHAQPHSHNYVHIHGQLFMFDLQISK